MELTNSFVVPLGIEAAWAQLLDVEALAPCFPGATLTAHDGDTFTGTVKIKLGPISLIYGGQASFVSADEDTHSAVVEATGKDARGTSTAAAKVRTRLVSEGVDRTRAEVSTDLAITGRPAQFGRGVMEDVAGRIIDQFAANLAASMTPEPAAIEPVTTQPEVQAPRPAEATDDDALDLVTAAGLPVVKRLAPVTAGLAVLALLVWWLRRVRRRA
jgi:uncharacterized protein